MPAPAGDRPSAETDRDRARGRRGTERVWSSVGLSRSGWACSGDCCSRCRHARDEILEGLVHEIDLGVVEAVVAGQQDAAPHHRIRSDEHTSELQSLMRISYAVFFLKKQNTFILT